MEEFKDGIPERVCGTEGESAQSKYWFSRRVVEKESPVEYMYRLNHYAKRAGIPIEAGEQGAEEHMMFYLDTVSDPKLDVFRNSDVMNIRQLADRMKRVRMSE